jgi:hypothetical protein
MIIIVSNINFDIPKPATKVTARRAGYRCVFFQRCDGRTNHMCLVDDVSPCWLEEDGGRQREVDGGGRWLGAQLLKK